MQYPNEFSFKVYGEYGLFSDPITRPGGEKLSLQILTYSAALGIAKAIYFKPTFKIYIDAIKVLNKIQTCSKGIRVMKYNDQSGADLSMYTYLTDVSYAVKCHFEWNLNHPELENDRSEHKHYQMMQRAIRLGGRKPIQLGVSECPGYVEPCDFDSEKSFYEADGERSFGLMFHSFIYPDEAVLEEDAGKITACFDTIVMKNGVIEFNRPEDCTVKRHIRSGKIKTFGEGKFSCEKEPESEVIKE